MSYLLHDHFESAETYSSALSGARDGRAKTDREAIHLLGEKLEIPRCEGVINRLRLNDILRRSIERFPATLVSGRAGTGKTTMAAAFAREHGHAAWYSVESSDSEWGVFSRYFAASVLGAIDNGKSLADISVDESHATPQAIAEFFSNVFSEAERALGDEPLLIVLDGIHHLFDTPWFGEFLNLLMASLPDNADVVLLCRSKPPGPMWRLRSKQQLNVIDEKVLAFDQEETAALLKSLSREEWDAERSRTETYGRISKLLQVVKRGKPPKNRA